MDARAKSLREILQSGSDQYLVPFFQRHYKWRRAQWLRLWEDIRNLMNRDAHERHFLGSLVCTPHGHMPGDVHKYQMIDGQQRMTTLTVLLAALRDRATTDGDLQLAEQITENYLIHKWNDGLDRYRVLPRTGDRDALCQIVDGQLDRTHRSSAVAAALRYFKTMLDGYIADVERPTEILRQLHVAITDRLSLVVITIDDENPYEIFWSLNGKGLPLQQSDLIRNYLFMQVPLPKQDDFNRRHWQELEDMLGETGRKQTARNATRFYRTFVMRNGAYSRKEDTFADFKRQYKQADFQPEDAVRELKQYAHYYLQCLHPETVREEDSELSHSLWQIQKLEMTTAYPLIMRLMAMRDVSQLSRDDMLECLNYLASFVLRRSICGESTRPYSRWFVDAIEELRENARENLKEFLLDKQWPDNAAFIDALGKFDLYRRERKKADLMLKELERVTAHKEPVELDKLTIEHVMPQSVDSGSKGKAWREALGEDWQNKHRRLVNTLGNLTLTGYNSELSNAEFERKKAEFAKSHVELNKYFAACNYWTTDKIRSRGESLGIEVAKVWSRPEGQAIRSDESDRRRVA